MKNTLATIIIVVIILGSALLWFYYSSSSKVVELFDQSEVSGPTLRLVERLKSVEIDTTFFSDTEFLRLEPAPALLIESFQKGKRNPFLPNE
jgi:hypothetical protein